MPGKEEFKWKIKVRLKAPKFAICGFKHFHCWNKLSTFVI